MSESLAWRKSSFSGGQGNCVEVAAGLPGVVAIRDSKNPDGPVLTVPGPDWTTFVESVKQGHFSLSED